MTDNMYRLQPGSLFTPRRNNYYFSQLLDEIKFFKEQDYFTNMQRLVNRLALGSGVLCGLEISGAQDGKTLQLSPGVAVDALGRVIIVPEPCSFDPRQISDSTGRVKGQLRAEDASTVSVFLHYRESLDDFSLYTAGDCDTLEESAPDTLVERYRVQVSKDALPAGEARDALCTALTGPAMDVNERRKNLFEAAPPAWVEALPDDGVALGAVQLRSDGMIRAIDSVSARTYIYSGSQLLNMILCLADRIDEGMGGGAGVGAPRAPLAIHVLQTPETYAAVGQLIQYTLSVKNNGGNPLTNILLTNAQGAGPDGQSAVAFDLAAGASSADFVFTHTVTQNDLDYGSVIETFTAAVADPADEHVLSANSMRVKASAMQGYHLELLIYGPPRFINAGDSVDFSVKVTNKGNITLVNLSSEPNGEWDPQEKQVRLAPGEMVNMSWAYTVTQQDYDDDSFTTSVSVTACNPRTNRPYQPFYGQSDVVERAR